MAKRCVIVAKSASASASGLLDRLWDWGVVVVGGMCMLCDVSCYASILGYVSSIQGDI